MCVFPILQYGKSKAQDNLEPLILLQRRCHASGKFPELEELCDQFATFNVDEATKNTVMEYDMVFASPWQAGQRCEME